MTRILSFIALALAAASLTITLWPKEEVIQSAPETDEYPILEAMGYYQRFSHKLWLAMEKENWELAEFYVHELEEVTKEFVESNVVDEGVELSTYAQQILVPAIEEMDEAVDQKNVDLATSNYLALVNSCNACHAITKHAYIKILVPDSVRPYNQNFSLQP
jgi:hypothetical protein